MRLYLDVCALCRPFDDQSYQRIRMETAAVDLIMEHIRQGAYAIVASPAHLVEIRRSAHFCEDADILAFLRTFGSSSGMDVEKSRFRAEQLHSSGFGPVDAAHIAFAEDGADVFITCDDDLLRRCKAAGLGLLCMNPIEFTLREKLR